MHDLRHVAAIRPRLVRGLGSGIGLTKPLKKRWLSWASCGWSCSTSLHAQCLHFSTVLRPLQRRPPLTERRSSRFFCTSNCGVLPVAAFIHPFFLFIRPIFFFSRPDFFYSSSCSVHPSSIQIFFVHPAAMLIQISNVQLQRQFFFSVSKLTANFTIHLTQQIKYKFPLIHVKVWKPNLFVFFVICNCYFLLPLPLNII